MKKWQLLGKVKTCNEKVNSIISKKEELKKKYVNYYHTTAERMNQKMKEITDQIEIAKTKEIRQLQATHVSQIKKLKRKQYYLVKKNNNLQVKLENLDILFVINKALHNVRIGKRADIILNMVMNGDMFGEKGQDAGTQFIWREVRKTYPAWKLCQARDCAHQGCLNLQGIEAVRQVEELAKHEQGMLPSKSAIWREGDELLKEIAYPLFEPTHTVTELGEMVYLNLEKVFRFVLTDNGLTKIAQEEYVCMAFSANVAALTEKKQVIFLEDVIISIHAQEIIRIKIEVCG